MVKQGNQVNGKNNIEKRVADLELELLKMKVGKLETDININTYATHRTGNSESHDKRLSNIELTTEKLTNTVQTLLEKIQIQTSDKEKTIQTLETKSKDCKLSTVPFNREMLQNSENADISVLEISDSEETGCQKTTNDRIESQKPS